MSTGSKALLIFLILATVIGGVIFYVQKGLPTLPQPTVSPSGVVSASPEPVSNLIVVDEPYSDQLIDPAIPLKISGKARGYWFFEASFPARVVDANGKVLAEEPVMADGEWMTEDFVPFHREILIKKPTAATGFLILRNDNPSGLEENDRKLEIPLKFKVETTSIKIFFGNSVKDPEVMDCSKLFSVSRQIIKVDEVGKAALTELLKGPAEQEKNDGYFSSINDGVKINSVIINSSGLVKADFDDTLEKAVGGSCRVTAIRSQITQTLKQFPTVKDVVISINGRTEDILQP